MILTAAQRSTFASDILGDGVLGALAKNPDNADRIATAYNQINATYWVWKSSIAIQDLYQQTTTAATAWSWPAFIARTPQEQNAWLAFTSGSTLNPSLTNTRQSVVDILSGTAAVGLRTHLLSVSIRNATRGEVLFATGSGTTASPSTLGVEGTVTFTDILQVWGA